MSFEECLKEQFSWNSLVFYKDDGIISKFKKSDRVPTIVEYKQFEKERESLTKQGKEYNFNKGFFENYAELYQSTPLPNILTFA
jgi:hypothetical protein